MSKKEVFFIYNMRQADWFIKSGLIPIGCGMGKKGDAYILFERNEESNKVFEEWKESTVKPIVCK